MGDRIKKVMADVLGIDEASITESSSPDTIKNWDSLRHMNLIVALEEEFDVQFDETEMAEMTSFTAIVQALTKLVGDDY